VDKWDSAAVVAWLVELNPVFSKYSAAFKEQGIDGEMLVGMDDESLTELGVTTKLHRTKILTNAKKLAAEVKIEAPSKGPAVKEEAKAAPAPAESKKRGRGKAKEEPAAEEEEEAPEPPAKTRGRAKAKAEPAAPAPAARGRGKRKAAAEPAPEEEEKEEAEEPEADPEPAPRGRRGAKAAKPAPAPRKARGKSAKAEPEDAPDDEPAVSASAPAPAASSSSSSAPAPAASASVADEKSPESIEIVFSFDTTGSMYPCLTQVRNSIKETVTRLLKDIPHIRIAIIAHGDYCDKNSTYVIKTLNFTSDVNTLVKWVNEVGSTGGGDADECYELVLRDVQKLSWSPKADRKALVLIGDANPHPPSCTPDKIDWMAETRKLAEQKVKVYGIHALGYDHSRNFYETISHTTGGVYLPLDQFSSVPDFVMGICFRENSNMQLQQYEQEVKTRGRMNRNVQLMFDKLAGRAPTATAVVPGDLQPVPSGRFQVLTVTDKIPIKQFAINNGLTFKVGRGFYEFTKPEAISVKKEVVLMEKSTGDMFTGLAARKLIGLDSGVSETKLKPSTLVNYRVFVQSTSYNRVLVPGSGFLYEVDADR